MQLNFSLYVLLAFSNAVSAINISEDTISSDDINALMGPITINTNVYWSVWNINSNITALVVNSYGAFYISAPVDSPSLQISASNNFRNEGVVSLNSAQSSSQGGSNIHLNVDEFHNDGDVFLINSDGDDTSTSSINADSFANSGTMTFYKSLEPNGIGILDGSTMENTGNIYIFNQDLIMNSVMEGSGCIHIQGASNLEFNNPLFLQINQIFYMEGSSVQLTFTQTNIPNELVYVYGFGNGNRISINDHVIVYDYNDETGILSINGNTLSFVYIKVGFGYDPIAFSSTQNAIMYSQPPPNQDLPEICKAAPPIPIAPTKFSTTSSASSRETSETSSATTANSSTIDSSSTESSELLSSSESDLVSQSSTQVITTDSMLSSKSSYDNTSSTESSLTFSSDSDSEISSNMVTSTSNELPTSVSVNESSTSANPISLSDSTKTCAQFTTYTTPFTIGADGNLFTTASYIFKGNTSKSGEPNIHTEKTAVVNGTSNRSVTQVLESTFAESIVEVTASANEDAQPTISIEIIPNIAVTKISSRFMSIVACALGIWFL